MCVGAVYYIQIRKSERWPPLHLRTADQQDPGMACVCVLRALVPFFFEGAAISGDASEVSHGATNFTTDLAATDDL